MAGARLVDGATEQDGVAWQCKPCTSTNQQGQRPGASERDIWERLNARFTGADLVPPGLFMSHDKEMKGDGFHKTSAS